MTVPARTRPGRGLFARQDRAVAAVLAFSAIGTAPAPSSAEPSPNTPAGARCS
ncbi:hypothetical protein ACFWUZ_23655 [Streptomyces sp. NPDC058646]|uniref:hypothetical protein n=1 Tax=Streptomyces sp. NPDC058646 TaxID=3346574 RepID=UPI0036566FE8